MGGPIQLPADRASDLQSRRRWQHAAVGDGVAKRARYADFVAGCQVEHAVVAQSLAVTLWSKVTTPRTAF